MEDSIIEAIYTHLCFIPPGDIDHVSLGFFFRVALGATSFLGFWFFLH